MLATWSDGPLGTMAIILLVALLVIFWGRKLIIFVASGPDRRPEKTPTPRRPGASAIPPPRICGNESCAAPARPDAVFCHRCGTRLA
jgi:hypothetical protein